MSLATGGAGAGGAGAGLSMAAMAHGGPSAMATHQHTRAHTNTAGGAGANTAAPMNAAALGADQLDKNQNLNWKQIKSAASYPIVAMDLYGDNVDVALFPSVEEKDDEEDGFNSPEDWVLSKHVKSLSSNLTLNKENETSYKALRKLLTKSKGYNNVLKNVCDFDDTTEKDKDSSAKMEIPSPQLLLGIRQVKQLHKATMKKYTVEKESTHAIQEDTSSKKNNEGGVFIQNGNLDGTTVQQNNDFDRVTLNLKLHSSKKTLTVLPEEAVGLVVAKAKQSVHESNQKKNGKDNEGEDEDDEEYLDYPLAFALPAWACHDNAIDSLMDACQGTNAVLYQRSVAALAGALVPPGLAVHEGKQKLKKVPLFDHLIKKIGEHAKKTQVAEQQKKPLPNPSYAPMVIMAGLTDDGIELTAVEVKKPNPTFLKTDCHVPFQEFNVIASIAYHHTNPLSLVQKAFCLLTDLVDETCPELEEDGGVAAIVTYGSIEKQVKLNVAVKKTLEGIEDDEVWKQGIHFESTPEHAVSIGTAVLAAVSHSRISRPSVDIYNVAPNAVGISYNFHGGKKGTSWTDPKVIFDYDRRVPAGPYKLDFSAAECVAMKENPSLLDDTENIVDEAEKWNKAKFNGLREEAALNLRIRIVQRVERDGKWRDVGDVFSPLTKESDEKKSDDDSDEGEKYAIETSTLEMSLDSIGFLTSNLSSDGKSVEQALKSAKSSALWYWVRLIGFVGFVGGFLIKSYVDDVIRKNCVQRVLGFYRHNAANTINDGDEYNANYVCYKYKGKKAKLWKRLETKYGAPVLTLQEYEELDAKIAEEKAKEEEEKVDLDEEEENEEL
mmetsp:Transcript_10111/g.12811  ORF Transcript_10111/g.12811 Transcript_10111/m.12811 type:complete len:833 (+) Transcript_10111:143-2641(+)